MSENTLWFRTQHIERAFIYTLGGIFAYARRGDSLSTLIVHAIFGFLYWWAAARLIVWLKPTPGVK